MRVSQWITVFVVYAVFHCFSDVFVEAQDQVKLSALEVGYDRELLKTDESQMVASAQLPATAQQPAMAQMPIISKLRGPQATVVRNDKEDLVTAAGHHGGKKWKKVKKHKKKKHGGHGKKGKKKKKWGHHGNYQADNSRPTRYPLPIPRNDRVENTWRNTPMDCVLSD